MGWKNRTRYISGGDGSLDSIRIYNYHFKDSFWGQLLPYRANITLPFDTRPGSFNGWNTNGDARGHLLELEEAPFCIKGHNVMEWARETITTGEANFEFRIEDTFIKIPRDNILTMTARFRDKGMAAMFKMAFH